MYVAILTSKPHTDALRSETKPRHDAYWDKHLDRIKFAGPILSDDGQTRVGQVLLLDVDDRQTAERIVTDDPFVQVGWVLGVMDGPRQLVGPVRGDDERRIAGHELDLGKRS